MFEKIKIEKQEKIDFSNIEKYRIRPTDQIPKPETVLQVGGKIISTRKNIFGITGKAKVGKSFLMALINACVLKKGELGMLSSYLPKGKDKIIYIDTEQSDYHVALAIQRVKKMVEDYKIDNLLMYAFDAVNTDMRRAYTEHLIQNTEGVGLVIIDGIADLVKSINDEIIATEMSDTLRKWATINDVAIGYVLHQNPSDSSKMRGHLGTILMNKSETVLQISSTPEDDSIKIVEALQTRNAKPENFSFKINEGMPEIMEECYQPQKSGRKPRKTFTNIERYNILLECYKGLKKSQNLGYSVLIEKVRENTNDMGENAIKEFLKYAKEMNWINQDVPKGGYFLQDFSDGLMV